ncbi:MAG: PQQ-binding-like beta-propeller repeat protein [Planctomycetes bacterium]|nr:PQQ-binding-like beta-propeller repeat protein [Planctomycetota bacterium]
MRPNGIAVMRLAILALGFAWTASRGARAGGPGAARPAEVARSILAETGVRGGLVVHLGCGGGELTAALRAGASYLVHGLSADGDDVRRARAYVRSVDLYGPVSIDLIRGERLPYVDHLVSLIVSQDPGAVPSEEILRALAPGGVALIETASGWRKMVKPRPSDIDEWTHFLYDASNNAVSRDRVVGPPRQLQWIGGPSWARSHDHLASVSACVSSGGRIFSIVDEGPIAAVILEPRWRLIARDAFSGVILWKREIPQWEWHLRGFRSGPSDLARRLVAQGERVYVTLGIDAPVEALDAATGRTLATYDETAGARELVLHEGILFAVVGVAGGRRAADGASGRGERPGFSLVLPQRPAYPEPQPPKSIVAFEAASGRRLWRKADADTLQLMPSTLAANGRAVFFQNADAILCLDGRTGTEIWRAKRPVSRSRPTWSAPTLVVRGDVVLSADRAVAEKPAQGGADPEGVEWIASSAGGQAPAGELIAFSARDGARLWSARARECYNAPADVLVADGLVWTGDLVRANEPGITEGRDPLTGEVRRTRPKDQTQFACGMGHGRCYRNKATSRFLILGRSGVEFIDLASGRAIPHHWMRGTCQYGVMPANGLLYAPPHSCACFIESKLNGFVCLAPGRGADPLTVAEEVRLERGPAYGAIRRPPDSPIDPDDWPTYRHDAARSGATRSAVPAGLVPAWRTTLGGHLSSLVIAGGLLFVAQIDGHAVHALRVEDGQRIWSYTAGGRIDSPPTIAGTAVVFGSADGWIYCLRASDGALAWRFRAAPSDRRLVAEGQIESCWPVHGSALVRDGVVHCAAGRSSYLDGGIRLLRLEAATGRMLTETIIDHRDPETMAQRKDAVRGTTIPGALPDILSCDGRSIHMRHTRFDLDGEILAPETPHLYSPAGFLDDSWWHRTYWLVGSAMGTNYGGWPNAGNRAPAGRLLAVGDSTVYGFGRDLYIHHGAHVGIDGATIFHYRPDRDAERRFTRYRAFATELEAPKARGAATGRSYRWTRQLPILARAMVLARDILFLAGPPDFIASEDPIGAIEGRRAGSLIAVSRADGTPLAERALDSPPVFDGMAAAGGRLYIATVAGDVACYRGKD